MANRILWIAPNLNHYKVRQLNRLSSQVEGIKVLHGMGNEADGHRMPENSDFHFDHAQVNCRKKDFSRNIAAFRQIIRELSSGNFEVVLMPMEKKHLLTILLLYVLKHIYKFRLASYNHHYLWRKSDRNVLRLYIDKKIVCFVTKLYDIVVYYTEGGMRFSIEKKMVYPSKAFFASNTIDVEHIFNLTSESNIVPGNNILFIGRILPSKRVDVLLEYFLEIRKFLKDCKLFIIGEGPESDKYMELSKNMADVSWLGGIVEEEIICEYAQLSKIVFAPGASGLSIVHSFAYGKPYVTMDVKTHGPEIDYLVNGENGLILSQDDKKNNVKKIVRLLTDEACYGEMSAAALETAKKLTLEKWAKSMRNALNV